MFIVSFSDSFLTAISKGPHILCTPVHTLPCAHIHARAQLMTSPPADPLTLITVTKRQIAAAGQ